MDFVRGTISGDLTEVPGIGPKTAEKLAEGTEDAERVTNTYQLVGKVSREVVVRVQCLRFPRGKL